MSLAALQKEFGPLVPQLPSVALRSLPLDLQQRFRRFSEAIERTFLADDLLNAVAQAGQSLFPKDALALFPSVNRGVPRWMFHTFTGTPTTAPIINASLLPRTALYRNTRDDPFADRVVNLTSLYGLCDPALLSRFELMHEVILEPNGMHHQLRAVLYDEQREAELFVGFYRRRGLPPFSVDEHVLLQLALPLLRAWYRTSGAIGLHPLGDHALATALDANPLPCWLLDGARIVFANLAARRFPEVPPWVRHVIPGARVQRIPLAPNGHPLTMVLGPGATAQSAGVPLLDGLPPSLREVAELAASGRGDKEIALALRKPVATVRTYLARVYVRLGIHGRRELMRGG